MPPKIGARCFCPALGSSVPLAPPEPRIPQGPSLLSPSERRFAMETERFAI